MKISINQKLIDRNIKISQYTLYISLALLAIGFIWSIRNTDPNKAMIGWFILIPSYFLVQISIFMANKWGNSPRPDEAVIKALKGMNNEFSLYSFTTAVPHLLIGPIGIWIINPYHQTGEVSFNSEKSSYEQKGGPGFIGKYFGQEGLPNITRDVKNLKTDLSKYFIEKSIPSDFEPKVVNLFYADEVKLKGNNFPELCIKSEKLKDFIRKHAKKRVFSAEDIAKISTFLPDTD